MVCELYFNRAVSEKNETGRQRERGDGVRALSFEPAGPSPPSPPCDTPAAACRVQPSGTSSPGLPTKAGPAPLPHGVRGPAGRGWARKPGAPWSCEETVKQRRGRERRRWDGRGGAGEQPPRRPPPPPPAPQGSWVGRAQGRGGGPGWSSAGARAAGPWAGAWGAAGCGARPTCPPAGGVAPIPLWRPLRAVRWPGCPALPHPPDADTPGPQDTLKPQVCLEDTPGRDPQR